MSTLYGNRSGFNEILNLLTYIGYQFFRKLFLIYIYLNKNGWNQPTAAARHIKIIYTAYQLYLI